MPRLSKKRSASQNNWTKAVGSIKAGTKRALAILTPRKKKRKTDVGKENDEESVHYRTSEDEAPGSPSFVQGSCDDDDFFQSPAPRLSRQLADLPPDVHSQFGKFTTNTRMQNWLSAHVCGKQLGPVQMDDSVKPPPSRLLVQHWRTLARFFVHLGRKATDISTPISAPSRSPASKEFRAFLPYTPTLRRRLVASGRRPQ
ncbi:hypothetical protein B0H16DRAFT_1470017 [Mycena metata]|uniref:Uncharacterized protein n=1 Tax=Mycena metata TaxID=1033252 RepID=A0AAD7HXD1_9AGAR|nr:hypothetical protein B0H16DRAFT_1470017 [Mycena metata]